MNPQVLNNISLADPSPVLQAILDALPSIYYLVDRQGRFVRWNQRSIHVTGYSDAEHRNMNVIELFRGTDCDLVANCMREVFEKGRTSVEVELVTKDGRVSRICSTAHVLRLTVIRIFAGWEPILPSARRWSIGLTIC